MELITILWVLLSAWTGILALGTGRYLARARELENQRQELRRWNRLVRERELQKTNRL